MAPRYSLLQDDDLNSLIDPQALSDLQPTQQEMAPSPSPQPQAAPQVQMPQKDPELDSAWRSLELQKIDEARKPSYGFGEAARDIIPTGAALLLDGLLNHGRGALGVVQGGMNEVAQQQALRDKARQDAGELAVKLHGKGQDAAATARLQYAYDALQARKDAAGGVQNRWSTTRDDRNDPNSQRNNTARTMAYDTSYGRAQGSQDLQHDINDRIAGDQANIAAATTNANIDATHGKAPIINADAADKANAVATAGIAPEVQKQTALNPVLEERSLASANGGVGAGLSAEGIIAANPGLDFGDSKLLQQALKTRTINAKTLEDIKAANRAREIYDRMHEAIANYQGLPISEMATGRGAELRNTLAGHAKEYAGVVGKMSGNNSIENARSAEDLVPNIHNPYALDKLKGIWSSLEANINGNLGAIGGRARMPKALGGTDFTPSAGAAAEPVGPPPGAGMPGYNLDGNLGAPNLGDTGGRRDVPPLPAGAAQSRMVTVRLGNEPPQQVPSDLAMRMKQLEPGLEIIP